MRAVPGPLLVVSDSTYVVNCFRDKWWVRWQANGWKNASKKPVANVDLWQPLIELYLAVLRSDVEAAVRAGRGCAVDPRRLGDERPRASSIARCLTRRPSGRSGRRG